MYNIFHNSFFKTFLEIGSYLKMVTTHKVARAQLHHLDNIPRCASVACQ